MDALREPAKVAIVKKESALAKELAPRVATVVMGLHTVKAAPRIMFVVRPMREVLRMFTFVAPLTPVVHLTAALLMADLPMVAILVPGPDLLVHPQLTTVAFPGLMVYLGIGECQTPDNVIVTSMLYLSLILTKCSCGGCPLTPVSEKDSVYLNF